MSRLSEQHEAAWLQDRRWLREAARDVEREERDIAMMTMKEAIVELGIDERKIDYALPQSWVDEMLNNLHLDPRSHFVWSYEDNELGEPRPITKEGLDMLKQWLFSNNMKQKTYKVL